MAESHLGVDTVRHSSEELHFKRNSKRNALVRLLERAIFSLTLFLVVLTAIPYGSVEVWWTSFFEAAIFAIACLWAVQALFGGGWQLHRYRWLVIPSISLILFCLLQTIPLGQGKLVDGALPDSLKHAISADPFETHRFAVRLAALTLLGAVLLRFTTNRTRLHALVLTVIGVGVASAVFGILRQTMQLDEMGFALPSLPRGIGYGQIISRNQFAVMMELALGLALGMVIRRGARYETSLFYLALTLPLGAALILANSRGGILTMVCQLLFLSLAIPASLVKECERGNRGLVRWQRRMGLLAARAFLIGTLVVFISFAVVWVGGERVVSNLSTVQQELSTADAPLRWNTRRVDIWRATTSMIKDHPLTGVGFGGYWIAITQYHDASGEYTPQQAHNDYLELLASGGVIGFAIVLWLVVVLLNRSRKILLRGDFFRRAACFGALGGMFGVAVHSLVDFGLHITINSALFVALIAISAVDIPGLHDGIKIKETGSPRREALRRVEI